MRLLGPIDIGRDSRTGDLFFGSYLNNRIRVIYGATGRLRTAAGGRPDAGPNKGYAISPEIVDLLEAKRMSPARRQRLEIN